MSFYAVVFKREFAPGEHWNDDLPVARSGVPFRPGRHRPPDDDSDRAQHWKAGELYSTSPTRPPSVPAHLEVIEVPAPPQAGDVWDPATRTFIDWRSNKDHVKQRLSDKLAELAALQAEIAELRTLARP